MSARRRRLAGLPLAGLLLIALHLAALLADPIAPYSATEQRRDLSYSPPTAIRLRDASGRWHAWPFVDAPRHVGDSLAARRSDEGTTVPVRLFVTGTPYRLLGLIPARRHLFGVDFPARIALLGTDRYGRDVFSRVVVGARLSLFAGAIAAGLSIALGLLVGAVAGFYGGWPDAVLSWLAGVCLSLPWTYLLLAARSLLPLDLPPTSAFLVTAVLIGAVGWARPAFLVRAVTAAERGRGYVEAARSCGASDARILARHVLPQAIGVVTTQAAMLAPRFVLAEITLSFLGLGVSDPTPSWGTLAAAMIPPGLVLSHWWLATPLVAVVGVFALYDRVARELELMPTTGRASRLEAGGAY